MNAEDVVDITLATIFGLLLCADVAVMVLIKTYKNFNTGLISVCLILFILARDCQLIGNIVHNHSSSTPDPHLKEEIRFDRSLHDISDYLFAIISFALLLQWYWTYQVLEDPVKALERTKTRCFDKVLITCFGIYTCIIICDIIFVCTSSGEDSKLDDLSITTGIILAIFGLAVLTCYCLMYLAFVLLMKKNPDLQALSQQINLFFIFMITILLVKFVLGLIYLSENSDFTKRSSKVEFYINISIELVFNFLLIYY